MKLSSQEKMVPGAELGEKLDNLAEYGYEGVEFGGRGLEERQDEIVKATENHPVKASTICAGYPGCLLDSDPEQRELAISGIPVAAEGRSGDWRRRADYGAHFWRAAHQ